MMVSSRISALAVVIAVLTLPAEAAIEPGIARLSAFWWP